jgi:hypothetical protein
MTTGKSNGVLIKMILTACISVIATGATTWFAFGQGIVDRTYLEHYDKNFSTWAKDKDVITERMNRISELNVEALTLIKEVQKQQTILKDDMKYHFKEAELEKKFGIEKKK